MHEKLWLTMKLIAAYEQLSNFLKNVDRVRDDTIEPVY
jgi:hypothetical protein